MVAHPEGIVDGAMTTSSSAHSSNSELSSLPETVAGNTSSSEQHRTTPWNGLNDSDGNIVYTEEQQREYWENYQKRNSIRTISGSREKLGWFSLYCLIANKTIGTGIFTSAGVILEHTGSKGVALLLWVVGIIVMFAGLQTYLELGLSTPRYRLNSDNSLAVVFRSGAEKVYLKYIFQRIPRLVVCVYGITYITIAGMTSGNSITFATSVLSNFYNSNDLDTDKSKYVTGLAIGVLSLACIIHGLWRTGGIWLNNSVGVIKTAFLIGSIFVAFKGRAVPFESKEEFHGLQNIKASFADVSQNERSHVVAVNLIIFTMSGFEIGSLVLGEVENPVKVFPKAAVRSFAFISLLYFAFTCAVYAILDQSELVRTSADIGLKSAMYKGSYVTQGYYMKIFDSYLAPKIASWFIAFSALGNIVVVTYTAARVKQEIAKEGIFPTVGMSKFFMKEFYSPVNALWNMLCGRDAVPRSIKCQPLCSGPFQESELEDYRKRQDLKANMTPIPALFLHFIFSTLLVVVATQAMKPTDGLYFLFQMNPYITYTLIGILMAAGLIYLHWRPDDSYRKLRWYWKVGGIGFFKGRIWAPIYLAGMIIMLVLNWIPPDPKEFQTIPVKWYLGPMVGTCIFFGVAPLYWALMEAWHWWTGNKVVVESRVFVEKKTWVVVDELTNIEMVDRKGPCPNQQGHKRRGHGEMGEDVMAGFV
ncbi:hypothetical protein BJ508DRAFT_16012 [Ascobolus immersus RN42]|uniref:Amino acid transporter n=1 Tax=Ascobolus immersus RN42 TaxID=1160509 RepID=A0A3N4HTK0_ASCIM|nr:hypothetical protein BJ508DRAFT_16012 [Ascobolus immersus RN42]